MHINVFSQTRENRILVGILWQERGEYCFQYQPHYVRLKTSIPLGTELPLFNAGVIRSKDFFPSLMDRIPSRQNPEYLNYCRQWSIACDEKDPLVLISTVGNRGPSSFIFRRVEDNLITGSDLRIFRQKLGLSLREFAVFIDIEPATLSRTEKGILTSKMLLRVCEMLIKVPAALEHQLHLRGQYLHDEKISKIKTWLEGQGEPRA